MNITKAMPFFGVLMAGKQLIVTIASSGQALVEGFVSNNKLISQAVTATTTLGPYLCDIEFKVSNLAGLVDVVDAFTATSYNPSNINQTGGAMSGVAITTGSVNNTPIGQTTPNAVKTSNLAATYTDSSGTPGNVTNNSPRGRAAFATATSSVVVTNSLVSATSSVFVSLGTMDATLTMIIVTPAAGLFTVTGIANATGITLFDFLVVN